MELISAFVPHSNTVITRRAEQRVRVTQLPARGESQVPTERRFHVYIMASRPWGTLYVGVTNDLFRRVLEHRQGLIEGFTKTYGVKHLVYFEEWLHGTPFTGRSG